MNKCPDKYPITLLEKIWDEILDDTRGSIYEDYSNLKHENEILKSKIKNLEKDNSHPWHDLRKSNSDLPDTSAYVLVIINGYLSYHYEILYYNSDIGAFIKGRKPYKPIAWQYIELFEGYFDSYE